MLYEILLVSYLVVALMLIGFVLIQQGKGADMGASFGAGGSNTVFGSSGSGNFMTRTTAVLASLFFFISLMIGSMSVNKEEAVDGFQNIDIPIEQVMPVERVIPSDIPSSESVPASPEDTPEAASDIPN
ncbi:preprotein translocase subunit SecG [Glaciecola sp. SC05]|uniref:preprotein translocase subunit SecG n=1 Tax=Glaciecola sp. SC05 TaxID=1987355 RepID=UPI00352827AB